MSKKSPYHYYMLAVALLTNVSTYIQAATIFFNRSATDVSLLAYVVLWWALASWFVYGVKRDDVVITVSSLTGVIGTTLVVAGVLCYG